ncbi:MAG TPA: hypothetical protein VFL57_14585 [Bryobacteraceae bacterium]|nr:hypothetical protein [Bryobacteraceae bacterium]
MPLRPEDLDFRAKLPDIPSSIDVLETTTPSYEERKPAISLFSERLQLGDLRRAELPFGPVFAGPRGEVHYFAASGSLFIRSAAISGQFKSEERPWRTLERTQAGDETLYVLPPAESERLASEAYAMLGEGRLLTENIATAAVELDQWAQLSADGKVMGSGGGTATVKFPYFVDGMPVAGGGAKSLVYAEPVSGQPVISGLFHAWRPVGSRSTISLGSIESVLAASLLSDPELILCARRGERVRINHLSLCYLALPAFTAQRHLFPALQVEASYVRAKDNFEMRFAKYVPAATTRQYASAGVFAHYLHSPTEDRAASAVG